MVYDPIFNLGDLDGSNGFVINGIETGDLTFDSGRSVSGAGDINGDGIDDLIVGSSNADPNGNTDAGESYVVFGSDQGFSASLEISDLNGRNGFAIEGINEKDYSGHSVSGAGDVNGDGIDDLIIGAPRRPQEFVGSGNSYVVFGSDQGFDASLELSDLDGSNGFAINGIDAGDRSGQSVSGAGDINGDGIDDLIIGAPNADPNGNNGAGESYVVFGSAEGFDANLELSDLDGSNGFIINGFYNSIVNNSSGSGRSVSGTGDLNGDGIDDLIIGAPWSFFSSGKSYVVLGSDQGFDASLELSDLDGSNGFVIKGDSVWDYFGHSVSGAGDINNDGFDDLIIGEPLGDLYDSGESYVVLGSDQGFSETLTTSNLDGSNGFVINALDILDNSEHSGHSVSGAGDINGDGFDDLIIGAPNADIGSGNSYVVLGSDLGFSASVNLSYLDGINGFVINGIDALDNSGRSVSGAGDINGDGFDDLIIAANNQSYVVFGGDPDPNLNNPPDAIDDAFSIDEYVPTTFDVLSNDSDVDGDSLTINSVGEPANGSVTLNSDNTLTYTPNSNFNGVDSFIYEVSDGNGGTDTATVNVTVGGPVPPAIEVETLVDADGDGIFANIENGIAGGSVTFEVEMTNTGDVAVTIDDIQDSEFDIAGSDLSSLIGSTLSVGDSATGTYPVTLSDAVATTVGTTGADILNGQQITETHEVTVNASDTNGTVVTTSGVATVVVDVKDTIAGDLGDDIILGGGADDILRGDLNSRDSQVGIGGNDVIFGGTGNDRIGGKGGNDQLFGDEGDDGIWGDDGDDLLRGGLGNDTLTGDDFSGGSGSDTFILALGEGTDIIIDFEAGVDLIGLADGLTFVNLSLTGNSIISDGETLAILNGIDTTTLTNNDFTSM
ncbi:Ig-like domain-containing protein [Capilliphycus salinus ALCB114379]|uniref:Ig-like domain-containing protein n=1 Tax=Capilliphycus salinus TaxID=2768948 RepID=UPI0039A67DA9